MDKRAFVGLLGVIVAALGSQLNDGVSSIALRDILGGMGLSHDPGTWFLSLYLSGSCLGIAIAAWWAVTLTFRRFVFYALGLVTVTTLLIPFAPNLPMLYGLRFLQGFGGGAIIPMMMSVALRVLPPEARLYGLIPYALTATVFPNLAAPVAALWTDLVGWHFVFYQIIPIAALSAVLLWYGMPHDDTQLERLKKIDWRGMLLAAIATFSLTTLILQGDRLDWWNSPLICMLALVAAISTPLLLINEWFHEVPLFRIQLLARRNLAYGGLTLFCFIIINTSSSTLPFAYLQRVQAFRPEQLCELTALIAGLQLIFLPIVAWLLDFEWVDARVLNFLGFACILTACIGDSQLTGVWDATQFLLWQVLQALGDALVIMPLLMMATNSIEPKEGPYGSALFNTPRGIAQALGSWLLEYMLRWRGALHSSRLADQTGLDRFQPMISTAHAGFGTHGGVVKGTGSLAATLTAQTQVLVLSDTFLVVAGIVVFLMITLLFLPERSYPPRIALASD